MIIKVKTLVFYENFMSMKTLRVRKLNEYGDVHVMTLCMLGNFACSFVVG